MAERRGAASGGGGGARPAATSAEANPPDARHFSGFWRLSHEDLAAALARHDLSGELLRVYLALGDLTVGFGRDADVVSLGQIAEHAGGMQRQHVLRGLKRLAALGLYTQEPGGRQKIIRGIVWPAPPPPVAEAGYTDQTVAGTGSTTVAKPVAALGSHQDSKKKKIKKRGARPVGRDATAPGNPPKGTAPGNGKTATADGAAGRIVALWCKGHKLRAGAPYAASAKGRLAGALGRLLRDFGQDALTAAVARWFGANRQTYAVGLFERKLCDGDADLTGRAVRQDPARKVAADKTGYRRAETPVKYGDVGKRFDLPAGGRAEGNA